MPTTLKIQFLTGRYHATPWNSTPNEGVAEPFPTPWRILRAVVAASYRIHPQPREQVGQLLDYLCEELPCYYVPAKREGHVRQSVPIKGGRGKIVEYRRLIDAFQVFGKPFDPNAAVWVQWPVTLPETEQALLSNLCQRISYLGRSESWVAICPADDLPEPPNAEPTVNHPDLHALSVMVPLAPSQIQILSSANLKPKERKLLPNSLLEALDVNYAELQRQRWNAPPGSQFISYRFRPSSPVRQWAQARQKRPTIAYFRLDTAILPPPKSLLELTDRVHRALTQLSDGHWIFSGKDQKQPIKGNQGHAQFLPRFNRKWKIYELVIYARAGFDEKAIDTLYQLFKMERSDQRHWYWTLQALGTQDTLASLGLKELETATTWESLTPFIAPRWPKRHRDSIAEQVRVACQQVGLPEPTKVEPYYVNRQQHRQMRDVPVYRPQQRYHQVPDKRNWLRLTFPEPVQGPIALGWNAHYGLGLFLP